MALAWVISAVVGQFFLSYFMFMLAVFAGGGIANGHSLAGWQMSILNASMFALPGLCALVAILLIYGYSHDWRASTYWWQLLPFAGAACYIAFVQALGK